MKNVRDNWLIYYSCLLALFFLNKYLSKAKRRSKQLFIEFPKVDTTARLTQPPPWLYEIIVQLWYNIYVVKNENVYIFKMWAARTYASSQTYTRINVYIWNAQEIIRERNPFFLLKLKINWFNSVHVHKIRDVNFVSSWFFLCI